MNLDRIISMAVNIVMRKVLSRGIDAGFDAVSRRGRRPEDMSAQELAQAQEAKKNARRAQKAMKAGRRIGRM